MPKSKEDIIIDISYAQWLIEYWTNEIRNNLWGNIDEEDLFSDLSRMWEIFETTLNYIKKDD